MKAFQTTSPPGSNQTAVGPTDRLLTVVEVSMRTGWKVSTVRKKVLRREIGYVKLGRSVRIPESEVQRLINAGFRPALTEENEQQTHATPK